MSDLAECTKSVGCATRDLSIVPLITFGFVEETIKTLNKSEGCKEVSKGYKYFSEKYISDIRVYKLDDGCVVKARSYRSQKKNESPHTIEIHLKSGPIFERDDSSCSCPIGTSGACGHITGLLYTLAHMETTGMLVIPTDVAKTSLPQTWHVPRGEKVAGSSIDNVRVLGFDMRNPYVPPRGIRTTLYNPIENVSELPLQELCDNLEEVDDTCMLLSVVNLERQEKVVDTKFGKFPKGSPLAVQQKMNSNLILNILDADDFPKLPSQNVMINNISTVLSETKHLKTDSLSVTNDEASEIESLTQLQSQDPKWHRIRLDRITASIAGSIVKRRKDYDPLVERLRTSRSVVTANMRHGIACEPTAAEAFVARMNDNVNIYPCGICVSPWSPWLAASPDRKVYCPALTPCYGLLEIKCPVNPLSQCVYLNKDENGFKLNRTHNYFHQIMMQLAVTGLEWCYLFVWTSDESHLELITFDSSRWQEMKDKLDMFYFDHYLKG
ncbi:uncharacterized protein LOC125677134 [Ostrea edulis]|uniref:uncharacterized protein LOC125677134 n=1 Tax=Ostrea edulis TaxID=37623 RepID=UPI0024AFCA62|nr:uncharacterized protein LOC125677134 [Ostrea edulis]